MPIRKAEKPPTEGNTETKRKEGENGADPEATKGGWRLPTRLEDVKSPRNRSRSFILTRHQPDPVPHDAEEDRKNGKYATIPVECPNCGRTFYVNEVEKTFIDDRSTPPLCDDCRKEMRRRS